MFYLASIGKYPKGRGKQVAVDFMETVGNERDYGSGLQNNIPGKKDIIF